MPVEINTADKAIALLERAVAEKGPDYIYNPNGECACKYFEPGTQLPGCIVGHVASYLGLTAADLQPFEHNTSDTLFVGNPTGMTIDPILSGGFTVRTLLREAQTVQDDGGSWGAALQAAKDVVES